MHLSAWICVRICERGFLRLWGQILAPPHSVHSLVEFLNRSKQDFPCLVVSNSPQGTARLDINLAQD